MADVGLLILAERLKTALEKPLPGWDAHSEMINYPRPPVSDLESMLPNARKGAVLVLIYPKHGAIHLVLTLRQSYKGHHSAQVSFPGGSPEVGDENLWNTALREAEEEIGIIPAQVEMLGMLSKVYIPPSNFLVSPFVGICKDCPTFAADAIEVARIIETPLTHLLRPETLREKMMHIATEKGEINVRYFDIDCETVWGATAMILNELKHVLSAVNVR